MEKVRYLFALVVFCSTFFSSGAFALIVAGFPVSIGVDGGVSDVKYRGQNEVGYFWGITGNLKLNDYSSLYTGYGETRADIPDSFDIKQSFTSKSIPLALQVNLPIILGNIYLRAGGNYYQNVFGVEKEEGWGLLGALGIKVSTGVGPGVAIEMTFQDRGDAETSTVAVGAKFGF